MIGIEDGINILPKHKGDWHLPFPLVQVLLLGKYRSLV
jgi:hypothetical protein